MEFLFPVADVAGFVEVAQQLGLAVLVLSSCSKLDLSRNKLGFYEFQEKIKKISGCRKDYNRF